MSKFFKKPTSWSFSAHSRYDECALAYYLEKVMKIKSTEENPYFIKGTRVHETLEDAVKSKNRKFDKDKDRQNEIRYAMDKVKDLRKLSKKKDVKVFIESEWAFTKDWKTCEWMDWANCWLRIKVDIEVLYSDRIEIIDWKTGRFNPSKASGYMEQLSLYALGAFFRYPQINEVHPSLFYVDEGFEYKPENSVYIRNDVEYLKKKWENKVRPLFEDTKFKPSKCWSCKYCFYRKSNKENGGGQCPL